FFFSSRRRHTRWPRDWSSDVCSSDLSFATVSCGNLYEDWYFVDDFTALGALNEAAVTVARKDPHDTVAKLAGGGAGGVYRNMIRSEERRVGKEGRVQWSPQRGTQRSG